MKRTFFDNESEEELHVAKRIPDEPGADEAGEGKSPAAVMFRHVGKPPNVTQIDRCRTGREGKANEHERRWGTWEGCGGMAMMCGEWGHGQGRQRGVEMVNDSSENP